MYVYSVYNINMYEHIYIYIYIYMYYIISENPAANRGKEPAP